MKKNSLFSYHFLNYCKKNIKKLDKEIEKKKNRRDSLLVLKAHLENTKYRINGISVEISHYVERGIVYESYKVSFHPYPKFVRTRKSAQIEKHEDWTVSLFDGGKIVSMNERFKRKKDAMKIIITWLCQK